MVLAAPALAVLVATACGADDDSSAGGTTTSEETTTSSTTSLPGGRLEPCVSSAGWEISAPADWATNDGEILPECSSFDPDDITVEAGTDARAGAIAAWIDRVAFDAAAAPRAPSVDRAATTIDGLQAVRLAYEENGEGLYPAGTPITRYLIDLGAGPDGARTFFFDAVGLTGTDHDRNVTVLDRMARTVDLDATGAPTAEDVIARFGGVAELTVIAAVDGDEVCLRIPPGGEPACRVPPAGDVVETVALPEPGQPLLGGLTDADVFRVDVHTADADATSSFLPVPVPAADARAFALPVPPGDVEEITVERLS